MAGQEVCAAAKIEHAHIVVVIGERAEVRIAKTGTQSKIGTGLPVVLKEDAEEVLAVIVAVAARKTGGCLKVTTFRLRRIIHEIPEIVEGEVRRPDRIVQIIETGKVKAELHCLRVQNFGGNVLVAVGPLVQMARRRHAKLPQTNAANLPRSAGCVGGKQAALGQPEGSLRVGSEFVIAPARSVGASFVQEGRREGMVPDDRKGIVDLRVVEELITQAAVMRGRARGNPVNREAGVVLARHVGIEASAPLFEIAAGRVADAVLGNIRNVGETATHAGCGIVHIGEVLRAQGGSQRRADV